MDIRSINEAYRKLNETTVYNGSPVDYGKLTYKSIGLGEGNQVHGWGFYFAANKDVADDYRKAGLTGDMLSFFGKNYIVNVIAGFNDVTMDHNNEALDIVLAYCLNKIKRNKEFDVNELIHELQANLKYYRNGHNELDYLYQQLENIKQDIENYNPPSDDDIQKVKDSIQKIMDNPEVFKDYEKSILDMLNTELNSLFAERSDNNKLLALKDSRLRTLQKIGKILNNDRLHFKAEKDTEEMISFIQKHKDEFNSKNIFRNNENQGIVKEFDIPDGPYIEEDKHIKEQCVEVKKGLWTVCNRLNISIEEQNTLLDQLARDVYKDLCEYVRENYGYQYQLNGKGKRADKIVSRLLNQAGIKGIHYFGEEDGECYVVFNMHDVKIIK